MEQDLKQEQEQEDLQAELAKEAAEAGIGAEFETIGPEDSLIAELRQQAEDSQQRFLRAQADFDNYRRRTMKEKEELAQYASLKLVSQLLPVLDNFGRALQTGAESADPGAFTKGVDMINRQLWQVLETEGLKAMEPVGQPFDPALHQAIMQVASDEYEEGVVVEVVQPGYWLKDKVIRPAMVKVSG